MPRLHPLWPAPTRGVHSREDASSQAATHNSEAHSSHSTSPRHDPDSVEDSSPHLGKQKALLALHTRLYDFFPHEFSLQESTLPYYESSSDSSPKPLLHLDPDLEHSWLRPPAQSQDTVGHWTASAKLPPGKRMLHTPHSVKKQLPRPAFFYVPDVGLRALLDAPLRDKEFLPLEVFDTDSISTKASPHALLDLHLRNSVFERFATDSYMRILVELSSCLAGTSDRVPYAEAASLLPEVVKQAALANTRLGQSLTAAFVGNAVALRDTVLDKFVVPSRTREVLRGGDFSTETLFGPLPESFKSLFTTQQGKDLRCTKKFAASSYGSHFYKPATPSSQSSRFQPLKRSGSSSGLPPAKRPASSVPASRGRGANFRRRPAGQRSKLGRY